MPITLYFLQTSRAIRTAWLLEELGQEYNSEYFDREANGDTPQAYRDKSGVAVGRSPMIVDGDQTVLESIAIAEYLCEKYDKSHKLIPSDQTARNKTRMWMAAAEGTFFVHALAIAYSCGAAPDSADKIQEALGVQVNRDFDWLESELKKGSGKFLVGDNVTAADTMMAFTIRFILTMGLGTKGKSWKAIDQWLNDCEGTETYKAAVKKTGHKLG